MAGSSKAGPELPRNIACAITLKAREMEARKQPAALLLVPHTRTLLAFRREAASSSGIVAVLARWTEDGSGKLEVQGKEAVQFKIDTSAKGPDPTIASMLKTRYLISEIHAAVLNCAVLDALLTNSLPTADTKAALTCPERCRLFPYTESHHGSCKESAMSWAQRVASHF